jgi:TPR repeat protein
MSSKMKGGGGKGSKKDGVGGGLVCAHCKKVGELDTMKRCGRCRRACYCSVECQKLHWKKGGHKKVCGKGGSSGNHSDGVLGASPPSDAPLKHPCPICLDNEDDVGEKGMCYSCGQMFCGSCKMSLRERGVTSCPTCRAALDISQTEQVRQLRLLLARPTGRHTPVAQFNLGACYRGGTGVAQDDAEAARWYRLAADGGLEEAQFNPGTFYEDGRVVAQDTTEALRWYRLAADQGSAVGQNSLGLFYAGGIGVAQNDAEAVRWYRLAADQGYATAQCNLGLCYRRGAGVSHDAAESVRWLRLAADQGYADAQFSLASCYGLGTGVAQDIAEAVRWYRLAADQGHAGALTTVARLGK